LLLLKLTDFALSLEDQLEAFLMNRSEIYQIAFLIERNLICTLYSTEKKFNLNNAQVSKYNFPLKIKSKQLFTSLANVWWPCGTYTFGIRAMLGVLWTEFLIRVPNERVQIIAYSTIPHLIHPFKRTPKVFQFKILGLQLISLLGTWARSIRISDDSERLD
jgi:hypothetical protein